MTEGKARESIICFSLLLMCARRDREFSVLDTGIGNRDNPFTAFAFQLKTGLSHLGNEMPAFTSGFSRFNGLSHDVFLSKFIEFGCRLPLN